MARTLARTLDQLRPTHVAHSAADALVVLEAHSPWCAQVVDINLGGTSGLEFVATTRALYPRLPTLIVTGYTEPALINRAFSLGAHYLCKPFAADALAGFAVRAMVWEAVSNPSVAGVVEATLARSALSPRETEILLAALAGRSREAMRAEAGVSENTLKSQVRSLLRKVGASSLDQLVIDLLRAAVVHESEADGTAPGVHHADAAGAPGA